MVMAIALMTVMSAVDIKDITITNLMWSAKLKTIEIVVTALYKLNNKYALELMRHATS